MKFDIKPVRVLSLFDGIGGGRIIMDRLGIACEYYASEIDYDAICVAKRNYPDIIELGDVLKLDYNGLDSIDLLLAGSPCQGFSLAGRREGLRDKRSVLFFEFLRALYFLKPKYFMLENVVMSKADIDVISQYLGGIRPYKLCASRISAVRRNRLYWTNLPFSGELVGKTKMIGEVLKRHHFVDITKRYIAKKSGTLAYIKSRKQTVTLEDVAYCITTASQAVSKSGSTNIKVGERFYTFNVEGIEILHGYKEGYTKGFSEVKRSKC
jgi:hypothetical protein